MFAIDRRHVLLSALQCLCLLSMTCRSQAQPSLDGGPDDAVVREGETVDFVCDLRNVGDYSIYWYYNHGQAARYLSIDRQVGRSTPLSSDLLTRLSIVGDEDNEEFPLRIENVRKGDEGTYSCQYGRSGEIPVTAGMAAELTVLVPPAPQSPWCSTSAQLSSGAVGGTVYLYCNSQGGDPPPIITYYKGDERLVSASGSIAHQYHIIAEDNGVIFTCVMTTPALDGPRSCSVMPLRILPNATILPTVSRVEEGSYASFDCHGEGLPYIAKYRWTVTNNDTGEILSAERYTVSQDGRSVEIAVNENLELLCTVSVPSGLSDNSTARVEVTDRKGTTETVGPTKVTNPTSQPSTSPAVPIVIVVLVLAVVAGVVVFIVVWRRKQQRKSKIPIDPKDGYNLRDIEDEYDEVGRHGPNGRALGAGTAEKNDADEHNGREEQGTVSASDRQTSESALYANPGKRPKDNGEDQQSADQSAVRPPAHQQDIPLYAQPDKSKIRKSEDFTGSEYSTVSVKEPVEADSGLVYADLDLETPGTTTENTEPHADSEQTVYAMIRT